MTNTLSTSDLDITTDSDNGLAVDNETAAEELARFRVQVREAVIKQHNRENGWCRPGSDEVLQDLGLPPIEYSFAGTVSVNVDVYIPNAPDRFDAAHLVADHLTVQSDHAMVEVRHFELEKYAEDELNGHTAH